MRQQLLVAWVCAALGWATAAMWAYIAGSSTWFIPAVVGAVMVASGVIGLVDER